MQNKWQLFSIELGKIFQLWVFGVLFFFLYRLSFIFLFRAEIQDSIPLSEYIKVFSTGFRTDGIIMSYFTLLPLAVLFLFSRFGFARFISSVRRSVEVLFVILAVTISLLSLNYYNEFHVNFDNNLYLGLVEENFTDVCKMILNQKNSVIFLLVYLGLLSIAFLIFYSKPKLSVAAKICMKRANIWSRGLFLIGVLILFCGEMRGSFTAHNFRVHNTAVSKVYMLNRSVLNPFKSLEVSFKEYRQRSNMLLNCPYAESETYNLDQFKESLQSIDHTVNEECLRINKPKQIFLVIMESYDSWSLDEKYRPFNVSANLAKLADNGTSFINFLPAYNATIYAYSSIVSSIPYFGVNIAQMHINNKDKQTISIFNEFSKMGYHTNLFYGGFISWQKIEEYSLNLACDHVYSAADIDADIADGSWGVEDEKLFDMVLNKIDPDEYSFNIILTTSYHNPFPIDVLSKGYPYRMVDDLPESVRGYFDGTITLNELGHRWYGDYAIGRFMDTAEVKYGDALYAYTGDHYARKFINANPTLYEKSLVPFILYGKGIPSQQLNTPGSHIDILPTLIDMIAPVGYSYKSFGSSMFDTNKKLGIAYDKLITRNHLFIQTDANVIEKADVNTRESTIISQLPYSSVYKKMMKSAWYYISENSKNKI